MDLTNMTLRSARLVVRRVGRLAAVVSTVALCALLGTPNTASAQSDELLRVDIDGWGSGLGDLRLRGDLDVEFVTDDGERFDAPCTTTSFDPAAFFTDMELSQGDVERYDPGVDEPIPTVDPSYVDEYEPVEDGAVISLVCDLTGSEGAQVVLTGVPGGVSADSRCAGLVVPDEATYCRLELTSIPDYSAVDTSFQVSGSSYEIDQLSDEVGRLNTLLWTFALAFVAACAVAALWGMAVIRAGSPKPGRMTAMNP